MDHHATRNGEDDQDYGKYKKHRHLH